MPTRSIPNNASLKAHPTCKRFGIMGGTFDPIHYGHLVVAEEARVEYNLLQVYFVPCGIPPHKKDYPVTSAEHRYLITALAVASNSFFQASRMEIERKGPSYTIDTIREFKNRLGEESELYFITGVDAILEILTWHKSEEIIGLCYFIAASRPGYHLETIRKNLKPEFLKYVTTLEVPALAISSTDIRNRIKLGKPIKYLVPESVETYIYEHKLYR